MHEARTTRSLRPLVVGITITLQATVLAQQTSVRGTLVVPEDEPAATAVALMLRAHPNPSGTDSAGSLDVLQAGIFVGPTAPVDDHGRFVLVLPPADTLPSELIGPAHGLVAYTGDFERCELVASDPLARTTITGFAFVTAPGIALTTDSGTMVGVATDVPFDMIAGDVDVDDVAFQVWVYADRDVRITTPPEACSDDDTTLHVDVALLQGWNRLEWRASVDDETHRVSRLTLANADEQEVFVVGVIEF